MIVVTGATGTVGRAVVENLHLAGQQITAVARREPREALPQGVRFSAGDLQQPAGLRSALAGVEAVFLLALGENPAELLEIVAESGISRVVLLSSIGAGTRPEKYPVPARYEEAVRASELAWTILRPGGFASNSLAWADSIRRQRTVFAPFADVALPIIDPADIAAVAATVLRSDDHRDRVYELTGPEPLTPREQVATISAVLGEPVELVQISREAAREQMVQLMPTAVAEATLAVIGAPLPQEQRVSFDVQSVTGAPARSYRSWVESVAGAFR